MPPPATSSSHRRFSSTVTFRQGPHSAEALEGALRLAEPFSYSAEATHVLFNSPFLRLPDFASVIGPPRIDPSVDPVPPELSVIEWLHNRAPRLIPQRFRTFSPVPRGLVDFFNSNIHLVQVAMLLHQHLCNDEDAVAEARRHKRDFSAVVFLRCPLPGTPAVINTPPPGAPAAATNPSVTPSAAIPLPDSLPNTALAPRPMLQSLPLGPTPFQPSQPSQAASDRPQHPPPFLSGSDSKRPPLPGKGASTGGLTGYMAQFSDQQRLPVGFRTPKDNFKGKDKGQRKGPEKGKPSGKGVAPPPVRAPPAHLTSPPGPP